MAKRTDMYHFFFFFVVAMPVSLVEKDTNCFH